MLRVFFIVLLVSISIFLVFYFFTNRVKSISGDDFKLDQKTLIMVDKSMSFPYSDMTVINVERKSNSGDCEATFELARRYINGVGVAKDTTVGDSYLNKAILDGSARAAEFKAVTVFDPDHISKKNKEALELMTFAAKNGMVASTIYLCRYYYADKRYKDAVIWCAQAADMGAPLAMEFYGDMLASGDGVSKDKVAAGEMICKARSLKRSVNYTLARHNIVCGE